jgi:hypothetical protein
MGWGFSNFMRVKGIVTVTMVLLEVKSTRSEKAGWLVRV